jgi:glycosyltransferase involved in cell wall biosynthesis
VILHINAVGAVMGGATRHLPPFVDALTKVRPDWDLVVYASPDAPIMARNNLQVRTIRRQSWRRIVWDSYSVGRHAKSGGADALLNLANYGPLRSTVPSVLYQRNPLYFDPVWVRAASLRRRGEALLRRQLAYVEMRGSAATVTPSNAMAGYLRSWHGYAKATRIEVIPHAVDIERFTYSPRQRSEQVRVVCLSHAAPHKCQELLVDVIDELRARRGVDVTLEATISEEDDRGYVRSLRRRIETAGLGSHVKFVGRVDAAEFLAGADLMILPSKTESFGFPIVEAMACGVPIVASAIPSTRETLGHLGWYFPVGDAGTAASSIMAVLAEDPAALDERMQAARITASNYTWERNARSIAQLVEDLVDTPNTRAAPQKAEQ